MHHTSHLLQLLGRPFAKQHQQVPRVRQHGCGNHTCIQPLLPSSNTLYCTLLHVCLQALLHELDRRLSKLEASWPSSQPVEAGNRAVAAQPAKPASAAPAAVAPVQALVPVAPAPAAPASNAIQAAPPQQHQDCAAGIQELQRQHALLASQLAALKDVLAATTGDVHQQLAGLANNKADAGQLAVLADALSGKADSRDLEQTKKQLAGKADRDELDALLNSLAAAGSTEADGGPAVTALGASGAADWDKKLQLQLTLLQERIAKKVRVVASKWLNALSTSLC